MNTAGPTRALPWQLRALLLELKCSRVEVEHSGCEIQTLNLALPSQQLATGEAGEKATASSAVAVPLDLTPPPAASGAASQFI